MSRVAKMPIVVPAGAEVAISAQAITVKGPLGTLTQSLNGLVKVENNAGTLSFDVVNDSRESNAMSGTLRALVNNMVVGVTKGFEKKLSLVGVGYKAQARRQAEPVPGLLAPGRSRHACRREVRNPNPNRDHHLWRRSPKGWPGCRRSACLPLP